MRYPASEKAEIIRLVETSHLPVRRTLEKLGIPRATFYRWYDLYRTGGPEALGDRSPRPDRVWNRIPEAIRGQIIDLALERPELSPRDTNGDFVFAICANTIAMGFTLRMFAGSFLGPTNTKSLCMTARRFEPCPCCMNASSAAGACVNNTSASPRRPISIA